MKTWKLLLFLMVVVVSMSSTCQACPNIITASAEAGGRIVPVGNVEVGNGESFLFSIFPDDGYEIKDVVVNGASVGPVETYLFSKVFQDGYIIAKFKSKTNEAGYFGFQEESYTVSEGAGIASVVVTRYGGSKGAVGVTYSTSPGTAKSNEDYTYTSNVLTWGDGDASTKTATVSITDDSDFEPAETFTITLSNPLEGAELGTPITTTITISNNDT
ncbi:MAG: Calx-beta domain-containing protein [Spirochaetota bacterium]